MADAVISLVQNSGETYSGYEQEVAKSIFYLIPVDDATESSVNNPMLVPEAGVYRSFELYMRARCDTAPVTRCFNFKAWYVSGLPGGSEITVNSDTVSTYVAPVQEESTRGTRIDFTTKNAEGNAIDLSGELTAIGEYTSYLVFQLELSSAADIGSKSVEFGFSYDEE